MKTTWENANNASIIRDNTTSFPIGENIVPERFNSITKVSEYPIVSPEFNSISEIKKHKK
ncbi:MAG: hypothetical protein ABSG89_01995 [Bacteroidales bacterium]|jgi:hypothetical protein